MRFTLHRQKHPVETSEADQVPDAFRADPRIKVVDEMPRMVLIDCPEDVANEWLAKLPGWHLQAEKRIGIPDPRPKLKFPPNS